MALHYTEKIKSICRNCGHTIWYDSDDNKWHHSNYMHDDQCICKDPVPKASKFQ